jgi:hypothetical protein
MNSSLGKYRCDWCNKPIYEEYWLIPPKPKKAFQTLISMNEKKMCEACFSRKSRRPKNAVKIEQIDAFPNYPNGYIKD